MKRNLMAASAAMALMLGSASAQGVNPRVAPPPMQNVPCPAHVSVVLRPTVFEIGWITNNAPVALSLDAKNPPRVESNELICYYAMPDGYNAFVYFQALGGRTCTVVSNNSGFVCHK